MAELVGVTLGPKGRNVVLQNKYGPPKIVNDGETVLKQVSLTFLQINNNSMQHFIIFFYDLNFEVYLFCNRLAGSICYSSRDQDTIYSWRIHFYSFLIC